MLVPFNALKHLDSNDQPKVPLHIRRTGERITHIVEHPDQLRVFYQEQRPVIRLCELSPGSSGRENLIFQSAGKGQPFRELRQTDLELMADAPSWFVVVGVKGYSTRWAAGLQKDFSGALTEFETREAAEAALQEAISSGKNEDVPAWAILEIPRED